jgi:hypothetical protein
MGFIRPGQGKAHNPIDILKKNVERTEYVRFLVKGPDWQKNINNDPASLRR